MNEDRDEPIAEPLKTQCDAMSVLFGMPENDPSATISREERSANAVQCRLDLLVGSVLFPVRDAQGRKADAVLQRAKRLFSKLTDQ